MIKPQETDPEEAQKKDSAKLIAVTILTNIDRMILNKGDENI